MADPSFTDEGALKVAVGATFATVTVAFDALDDAPWLSVTVSEAVYVPLSLHVMVGFCAVALLRVQAAGAVHEYVIVSPTSGSDEADGLAASSEAGDVPHAAGRDRQRRMKRDRTRAVR